MTAYELTRFQNDFTIRVRPCTYDANMLVSMIENRNRGKDLRAEKEYKEADMMFFECTSSCDRKEAIEWYKYFLANSIAYGQVTKEKNWMLFFLAAHDRLVELR